MPMIRGAANGLFSGMICGFLSNHNSNGAMHLIRTTTYFWNKVELNEWVRNLFIRSKTQWKLPLCMQSTRSRMFLMAVERSMFPTKTPSMASAMPANSANEPYWWKRANSKSNPYSRWARTTAIGRIPSKWSGVGNRSHHHLPRNLSNCLQKIWNQIN